MTMKNSKSAADAVALDMKTPESTEFCRICHDNSPQSGLIAPCDCLGTVHSVHRKCLECWLTQSQRSNCELCGSYYVCEKRLPNLVHWLLQYPRAFITDFLLCLLLSPLAILSVILCYKGAIHQVEWQRALESLCLFALGSFILGIYAAWICLTVRSHWQAFGVWRKDHPLVRVIWPLPSSKPNQGRGVLAFGGVRFTRGDDDDVFMISLEGDSSHNMTSPTSTTVNSSFRSIRLRSSVSSSPGTGTQHSPIYRNSLP